MMTEEIKQNIRYNESTIAERNAEIHNLKRHLSELEQLRSNFIWNGDDFEARQRVRSAGLKMMASEGITYSQNQINREIRIISDEIESKREDIRCLVNQNDSLYIQLSYAEN